MKKESVIICNRQGGSLNMEAKQFMLIVIGILSLSSIWIGNFEAWGFLFGSAVTIYLWLLSKK